MLGIKNKKTPTIVKMANQPFPVLPITQYHVANSFFIQYFYDHPNPA